MKGRTKGALNKPKVCNVKLSELNGILQSTATIPICINFAKAVFGYRPDFEQMAIPVIEEEKELIPTPTLTEFE